jgi:hypothetical protein
LTLAFHREGHAGKEDPNARAAVSIARTVSNIGAKETRFQIEAPGRFDEIRGMFVFKSSNLSLSPAMGNCNLYSLPYRRQGEIAYSPSCQRDVPNALFLAAAKVPSAGAQFEPCN